MRICVLTVIAMATAFVLAAGDTAEIYVYARRDTAARSWLQVSCGNAVAAELKQGTFFAIGVEPGRYTFFVKNGVPASVDVRSGEESFLRLDWSYGIDRAPIPLFSKIPASQARIEMKYLTYVPATRSHSSLVPRSDPSVPHEPQLHTRDEH